MLLLRNARPFIGDNALEFLAGAPQLDGDRRWHGNMRQSIFDEIGEELREEVAVASELAALLDFHLEQVPAVLRDAGVDGGQVLENRRQIDPAEIRPARSAFDLGNA